MNSLLQDLRYGLRAMLKSKTFTLVIVLVVALGVGVNVAIFSLVNAALIRPLSAVPEPDRLVEVFTGDTEQPYATTAYPDYVDYRDHNQVFSGLFAHTPIQVNLNTDGSSELIIGELVTANYFQVLGVNAAIGRTLTAEDDQTPGGSPVAVINYDVWRNRFGSDPNIAGRTISINGHPFNIVGVAPKGFVGTNLGFTRQLWVPMMMQEQAMPGAKLLAKRGANWLKVTGRLKPGTTLEQAQSNLTNLANQLAQAYPDTNKTRVVTVVPSDSAGIPPASRAEFLKTVRIAMGVVALVLLISCANVASLLLSRSIVRRKEIAIRLALGAGRLRLLRQLLTESLMISLIGGALGLVLALWLSRILLTFSLPFFNPDTFDVGLDWRVFTFALAISVVSGIIFGLAPALQFMKPDLVTALKDDVQLRHIGKYRLNTLIVAFQIALSLVLMIAAGLFVRNLRHAQSINLGFDTEKVTVVPLEVRLNGYTPKQGNLLYQNMVARLESLPGVESVSMAVVVPLSGSGYQSGIRVPGLTPPGGKDNFTVEYEIIAPKYFQTMGIPLLKGRDFSLQDVQDTPAVVIINQAMARSFWPNEDSIGKEFSNVRGTKYTIVGVVGDIKYRDLWSEPPALYYLPFLQRYNSRMNLLARTTGDPKNTLNVLVREVHELDKNVPLAKATALKEDIGKLLEPQRTAMIFSTGLSLLAMLLAILGLYGVMSYTVNQRKREIGIRMALGAMKREVIGLIIKRAMVPVAIGITFGVAGALLMNRFLKTLLYEISATDPVTFVVSSLGLIVIALLASYIPAQRATKVDPTATLRSE
jgi:putative ABC transport system permease protein